MLLWPLAASVRRLAQPDRVNPSICCTSVLSAVALFVFRCAAPSRVSRLLRARRPAERCSRTLSPPPHHGRQDMDLPLRFESHMRQMVFAVSQGVRRAHMVSRFISGSLLVELFTRDGSGVLMSHDIYEGVRKARSPAAAIHATHAPAGQTCTSRSTCLSVWCGALPSNGRLGAFVVLVAVQLVSAGSQCWCYDAAPRFSRDGSWLPRCPAGLRTPLKSRRSRGRQLCPCASGCGRHLFLSPSRPAWNAPAWNVTWVLSKDEACHTDLARVGRTTCSPLEQSGVLLPRSLEELEAVASTFTVIERDNTIIACASLNQYPDDIAELCCLAVHPARGSALACRTFRLAS